MIINNNASETLYSQIDRTKKIGKLGFTRAEFRNYCHTLNTVTGLDYDVEQLNGHDLAKYKVPKAFKGLVIPRKISLEEGTSQIDLRGDSYTNYDAKDYGYQNVKVLKPLHFNTITECILGSKKKEIDNNTFTLAELTGAKSLDSYKHRIAKVDMTKSMSEIYVLPGVTPFIPIDFSVLFQYDNYYNCSLSDMFDDWIEKALADITAEF